MPGDRASGMLQGQPRPVRVFDLGFDFVLKGTTAASSLNPDSVLMSRSILERL